MRPFCICLSAMILASGLSWGIRFSSGESNNSPPKTKSLQIGDRISDFELRDHLGSQKSLDDFRDQKLLVVTFFGTECPLAKLYASQLVDLANRFGPRGVGFVGINSNRQDSLVDIQHFARKHKIEFSLLKDPGNRVADQFGATRTPEVFVLDQQRVLRYHGRIDNQFGVGYARAEATENYVASTLEALLSDRPVATPEVEPVGCLIGRVRRKAPQGDITYTKDIVPILQKHCVQCHREGQIAPFALTAYDEVVGWAETMQEVMALDRMPPWYANPKYGHFANDARMPDAQKRLFEQWVENGMPEGAPADLPKPRRFVSGWRIPQPDLVISMDEAFEVPARGVVEYQYFTIDPGFQEDKWVCASEVRPGNAEVVHHCILYVQPPGSPPVARRGGFGYDFLAVFAPGTPAMNLSDGLAKFVPAGSKLVFQVHYTPNGTRQIDQTQAGLVFIEGDSVTKAVKMDLALNPKFVIPPQARNHRVEASYRFGEDIFLHSLMPHMHLRGKSFRFEAHYPDGRREVLLDVPRYDFNWQNIYRLARPKRLPEGTHLHCIAHFDNSEDNLVNPDPSVAVRFGEQTWDEMMIGYFEYTKTEQNLSLGPPRINRRNDGRYDVAFRYKPVQPAESVYLAGTFNDWKPTAHAMDGPDDQGFYHTSLVLERGRYEYKFVIEGEHWRQDPGNPREVGFYRNSVLTVGETRP